MEIQPNRKYVLKITKKKKLLNVVHSSQKTWVMFIYFHCIFNLRLFIHSYIHYKYLLDKTKSHVLGSSSFDIDITSQEVVDYLQM